MGGEVYGERLAQRVHRRLRRPVRRVVGLAPEGSARADVDDPATAALLDHPAGREVAEVRRREEVDGHVTLPGGRPVLVRGGGERVREVHRGVVDEHVQPAESPGRRLGDGVRALRGGQIASGEHVPRTGEGTEGFLRLLAPRAEVDGHHVAVGGERLGERAAEPARGTADEHAAAGGREDACGGRGSGAGGGLGGGGGRG
ncbi:hypothetical protein GCM10010336_50250 [Streptomyces goshikiensis]|nr:hypothetical protein GCM10010336_50250 [Streptomyces goshikiensis]